MKKVKYTDAQKPYWLGISIQQFFDIIKLATNHYYDWEQYDSTQITFQAFKQSPNFYNRNEAREYIQANIPLPKANRKTGKYTGEYGVGFECKLYDDGYFIFDNGSGCHIRHANSVEVYRLIVKLFDTEAVKKELLKKHKKND